MKVTPKTWASVSCLVVMAPLVLAETLYRERLPESTWVYLNLLMVIPASLAYYWVLHRHIADLPARPAPAAELSLASEPLPRVVWLAIGPPLLVAVLLWWVTAHGSELPWRHGAREFASGSSYRFLVGLLIFWTSAMAWMVVFGLAVWHGMSRAYQFRRAQLLTSVANQWIGLILIFAGGIVTAFDLPQPVEIVCLIAELGCGVVGAWKVGQLKRLHAANPRTGTWFYRDSGDPTFFGPRGVNLASGWCWILAGAIIPPIVLAEWMLHRVQG